MRPGCSPTRGTLHPGMASVVHRSGVGHLGLLSGGIKRQPTSDQLPPHLGERLHSSNGEDAGNDRHGRDPVVQRLEVDSLHGTPRTGRHRTLNPPIALRLAYQSCTSTSVSGRPATSHASRPPRYQ